MKELNDGSCSGCPINFEDAPEFYEQEEEIKETLGAALLRTIDSSPIPIDTPSLVAIHGTGRSNGRSQVWKVLRVLEEGNLIEKVKPKGWKFGKKIYWRSKR